MDTHRKIELQSPEDFVYLVDNVRRAAAESVQAAFPPVEPADALTITTKKGTKKRVVDADDLHTRVESLVTEYITRTFTLAAPNLSINGLPVDMSALDSSGPKNDEPAEMEEPFDTRKRQRVEDLSREEEDLLQDIARLKRRVPAAAVRAREQALANALAADSATVAALGEQVADDDVADAEKVDSTVDAQATADAQASFAAAVTGLGRLKQAMPATVARMERARVAADYAIKER